MRDGSDNKCSFNGNDVLPEVPNWVTMVCNFQKVGPQKETLGNPGLETDLTHVFKVDMGLLFTHFFPDLAEGLQGRINGSGLSSSDHLCQEKTLDLHLGDKI